MQHFFFITLETITSHCGYTPLQRRKHHYFSNNITKILHPKNKYTTLRGNVVSSYRTTKRHVKIDFNDTKIQAALCDCLAGISGTCAHVVAILLKLHDLQAPTMGMF